MGGVPVVHLAVGYSKQEATKVQWSDATDSKGLSHDLQRQLGAALAAAFADPITAARWI